MKIVIESHIPFIRGIFEPYVDNVLYLDPECISAESVRDADALIIRTRTRCNASLLDGSRCRIIATATIGTDHIDIDYCTSSGIKVCNAPGCNAPAVAQYVMASIAPATGLTLGIIGVGHVGGIVADWASQLGMKVLLNDPPRQESENDDSSFVGLDIIAHEADIITFHTPLIRSGRWATFHMADAGFFSSLKRKPVIINAARGPVVDTPALIHALETGQVSNAVIDCWENEPDISPRLLELALNATPHIAGYSLEGKQRATAAAVNAVARHLGIPLPVISLPDGAHVPNLSWEKITASYDIKADTEALRSAPASFEQLRNSYNLRHEP